MYFDWAKQLGGIGTEVATKVITDRSGNVYSVGWFEGTVDFDPGSGVFNMSSFGDKDVFVSKLDGSGNFLWAKKMGGTLYDYSRSITLDINGNVLITGDFKGSAIFDIGNTNQILTSSGINDVFISKLDSNGAFKWVKKIGGAYGDIGQAITTDNVGNVYTIGYYTGTVDFNPGTAVNNLTYVAGNDIFILKLDSNGDFVWAKSQGGNSTDQGLAIAIDKSGYIYTTGVFASTADFDPGPATYSLTSDGGSDIFISKLDTAGNFLWVKKIGGTSTDLANSISLDLDKNIYLAGYFWGSSDFDPSTSSYNLTANGLNDIFVLKLDSLGDFLWANKMGGTSYDQALSVLADNHGHVFTTGYFNGSSDFNPGADTLILTSNGASDSFLSCLDSLGNFIWANSFGNTNNDVGYSLSTDVLGNIYSCGGFQGIIDFDFSANVFNQTSTDSIDAYIFKLNSIAVGLYENQQTETVTIFPNPAKDKLNFEIKTSKEFMIELYNNLGQLLLEKKINSEKRTMDINHLSNGIYVIKIIDSQHNVNSKKIIINN